MIEDMQRNVLGQQLFNLTADDEVIEVAYTNEFEYCEFSVGLTAKNNFKAFAKAKKNDRLKVNTDNLSDLILFSNKGNVYKVKGFLLTKINEKEIPLTSLVDGFSKGERIINIYSIKDFTMEKMLYFFTKKGMVKKTALSEYGGEYLVQQGYKFKYENDEIIAVGMADDVLRQGVQAISDLITIPGVVNADFADIETVMKNKGLAHMGVGYGKGDNKAQDAVRQAISSPLLETSIDGATGVIINFTGGVDLGAIEVYEAAEIVREAADMDANIIFGAVIDETLNDEIRLTVIATGFEDDSDKSVLSTPEEKIEHKIEPTVKLKEEVNTEKIDPLLDLDRESVNIPSFLRSRK